MSLLKGTIFENGIDTKKIQKQSEIEQEKERLSYCKEYISKISACIEGTSDETRFPDKYDIKEVVTTPDWMLKYLKLTKIDDGSNNCKAELNEVVKKLADANITINQKPAVSGDQLVCKEENRHTKLLMYQPNKQNLIIRPWSYF